MATDPPRTVAAIDEKNLAKVRANVLAFLSRCGPRYDGHGVRVLDIAPQDHEGAAPHFPLAAMSTLDIDPRSGADFVADITADNSALIPGESFDVVVCTEVLEHTVQPFDAVDEIWRVLRPGGTALVTTPFNLRIHGPLPDCWRFTEHGLRALFKRYELVELRALEDPERFLMPTHYTLLARKEA